MLRQLARLTRSLPAAGDDAMAVAVYADAADDLVSARESGWEGVACIDDAARLLDVLCEVWTRTHDEAVERWARGVLEFVLWMQEPDGRWVNFVYDWGGTRNESGLTSSVGENFWHARALLGVANAWHAFGDDRALESFQRGFAHSEKLAPPDVRSLHVMAAWRMRAELGTDRAMASIRGWTQEIAGLHIDRVLMNNPDERRMPHLWAHIQEGVLAKVAGPLEDPSLLETARTSAERLLMPLVRDGFDAPSTSPYDVASVIWSLDRLAEVDGKDWRTGASDGRAWFDGRNTAGAPVYDRIRGRVADGVDQGRISANSGAEANLVAAAALIEDTATVVGSGVLDGLLPPGTPPNG